MNNKTSNGNGLAELERRLWSAADQLWANSPLRPSEYSTPVLGLIFLRFADSAFTKVEAELKGKATGRRTIGKTDYQAKGVVYIPDEARFTRLLQLPESADIGKKLNEAMKAIEKENDDLADVLPKSYQRIDNATLVELLKIMSSIPTDIGGDAFGKIYEYFLGAFAMKEGQKGGEFFTPFSMVNLIVEVIEPFHGRIFDPACGSGGMFVASSRFLSSHNKSATLTPVPSPSGRGVAGGRGEGGAPQQGSAHAAGTTLSVFGQERVGETLRLCKMNLAVHGLSGDIRQSNTYYEDVHDCVGRFDFVMANPPFNVSGVDKEKLKDDPRFRLGLPTADIANYLWIQIFYHALSPKGRAGFVMANSAADARGSEMEIRKKLIQSGAVDVIVSVGPNFFYTVTLPATLWFFDKGKAARSAEFIPQAAASAEKRNEFRAPLASADTVLFIDARHIYRQIDRAHREFTPEQVEFLANIVRLYRGKEPEFVRGSEKLLKHFAAKPSPPSPLPSCAPSPLRPSPTGRGDGGEGRPGYLYRDVPGLCKVATRKEIEAQGWSLNPGRYVGVAAGEEVSDADFKEQFEELTEELETLNAEARELEERITGNAAKILET
jgi:type I restriction enzyme M protein